MMLKLKRAKPQPAAAAPAAPAPKDPETGLLLIHEFAGHLEREISRGMRYGTPGALAIFDVRVAVSEELAGGPLPSPARHVAHILREEARSADIAARLDLATFAVLLINADIAGATNFTERCRTRIGSEPFIRGSDGHGMYARAWAGVTEWTPDISTPEEYVDAAIAALQRSFSGYEAAQSWFRGEGVYQPL